MSVNNPSLKEKLDYFSELDAALNPSKQASSEEDGPDDDDLDEEEQKLREKFQTFKENSSTSSTERTSSQSRDSQLAPGGQTPSQAEQAQSGSNTPRLPPQPPFMAPRKRVLSDPSLAVVKETPGDQYRRRKRLANPIGSDPVVGETPIPDTVVRPRNSLLKRIETTPLPQKRTFHTPRQESSPSVTLASKKRRKNDLPIKLVPEEARIFAGLRFHYIPDDDTAPVRRVRINKAREYGASWTRDIGNATHIIVDKHLKYTDIATILKAVSSLSEVPVVNEEFPLDCIAYKHVLNPNQIRYRVSGYPRRDSLQKPEEPASKQRPSRDTLPLKPPPANSKRWDHLPRHGTPSQDSGPSVQDITDAADAVPSSSQQIISVSDDDASQAAPQSASHEPVPETQLRSSQKAPEPGPDAVGDELSGYINMMQRFRALPLDEEHDDDLQSVAGATTVTSVSDRDDSDRSGGSEAEAEQRRARAEKRNNPKKKQLAFEERFACNQGGTKDKADTCPNARTIEVLQQMCTYYTRMDDHWRTTSYRKAIKTLQRQTESIRTAHEARKLPGIGDRIAQKIEEIVTTDRLRRLEYAQAEPLDTVLQLFLGIYGVGQSQANQWIAQGFRTLEDLKKGAKLTTNQRMGIDHYDDLVTRIPRREVEAMGELVKKAAKSIDPGVELIVGGSYRRGADSSGDIDFIVTRPGTNSSSEISPFLEELVEKLEADKFLVARLASSRTRGDGSKWHGCCILPPTPGVNDTGPAYRSVWRRIDFLVVPASELGAALLYFTGNDIFNRSMRLLASKKGMRLNQTGLYEDVMRGPGRVKVTEGRLVEGRDERRIFEILGVKWREPHERWC